MISKARISEYDRTGQTGRVSLVGAGPGAPDLITLRGRNVLEQADVVVFDDLVNRALLEHCPATSQRIYVGKRAGLHCMPQEEINAILLREARMGRHVVRLKGGDPLIFGRAGEEMQALIEAGIPVDVVPGVTAAIAAGAATGIPLTVRGTASAVIFVTGHESAGKPSGVDWRALARTGATLCIYMGARRLPIIAAELLEGGLPGATPLALIANATLPNQSLLTGTLETAGALAAEMVGNPTIVVIGEVVNWAQVLETATAQRTVA